MNLYCEKCESEDVSCTVKEAKKTVPKKQSIADFNGFSMTQTLAYIPTTYIILCKKCGNNKEITQ